MDPRRAVADRVDVRRGRCSVVYSIPDIRGSVPCADSAVKPYGFGRILDFPEGGRMSRQQARFDPATLPAPVCEYCGGRIDETSEQCPARDEGVCRP